MHQEILTHNAHDHLWKGHRVFAVDGSKYHLPATMTKCGYRKPQANAHYPQGLVSVLFRLSRSVPVDFDLFERENERRAACAYRDHVAADDVIGYDRGYYSFDLTKAHLDQNRHVVFHLKCKAGTAFEAFITSPQTEALITVAPPTDYPETTAPLTLRVVKYT